MADCPSGLLWLLPGAPEAQLSSGVSLIFFSGDTRGYCGIREFLSSEALPADTQQDWEKSIHFQTFEVPRALEKDTENWCPCNVKIPNCLFLVWCYVTAG